jgi:hypothetical protein
VSEVLVLHIALGSTSPRSLARRLLRCAVSCAVALLTTLPATAAPELTQKQAVVRAQRLIEQGKQHFQAREYRQGIDAYSQAQALLPDVKNLYVIASAYGYIPEACASTLEAWETFFAACADCDYRENAIKTLTEQRLRCRVTLRVESSTPGLRASHEGEPWGEAPLTRDLVVASYPNLSFSAPGYLSHSVDLLLKPGERARTLRVSLVPDLKPSFLDANRPFLGGVTGVAAVTALIYAISEGSAASDAVSRARRVNDDLSATQSQTRADALYLDYQSIRRDMDSAELKMWLGLSGALLFGGLSAWLWTRERDVKIDPNARPAVEGLSSLRVQVSPGGGALTLSF